MPWYISCHSIACMTVQQVRHVKDLVLAHPAVRLERVAGSQITGKLILEIQAPDRETLEQIFQSKNIHFDWVMRVEFDEKLQTA